MTVREIVALTPSEAIELQDKAKNGDLNAARDFILYGIWVTKFRKVNARSRDKIAVFSALHRATRVIWQTT